MGCAVIVEDERMINGDIRGALLKVAHWITASGHDIAQELVGFRHGASGAVNEARLNPGPGVDEPGTILGCEGLDMQVVDAFGALFE